VSCSGENEFKIDGCLLKEVFRGMLLDEKKPLDAEEIEAQTALELPDRDLLQLITIGDVTVTIEGSNIGVCANALGNNQHCHIRQG
jgi:hypothetical protein